jgi:hypothetical protein
MLTAVSYETVIEFGDYDLKKGDTLKWFTVPIKGVFNRPVVVLGPLSMNGGQPVAMRVKDVTRKSFKLQIQEYPNQDNWHLAEKISYMIVESGVHTLKDGTVVEAGITSAEGKYERVDYQAKFKNAPVVLTQLTTQWKSKTYVTRVNSVTNKQFKVKIQASEKETVTEREEISWVAFSVQKKYSDNWFVYRAKRVSNKATKIAINTPNKAKYRLFATVQTEKEKDTVNVRYKNLQ